MTPTRTVALKAVGGSVQLPSSSRVQPEDLAVALMTDFRHTSPICVDVGTRLEDALKRMIYAGVRLLFVKDAKATLLGHVTAADIQGEKPLLYLQSGDCRASR